MDRRGFNQASLAQATAATQSSISYYLRGLRLPGAEEIVKLTRILRVSADDLLGIEGNQQVAELRDEAPKPRNWGGPYYGTSTGAPLISWASGGDAHTWEDQGHDVPMVQTNCKDPNCYALELAGDSMEHLYTQGDILVVAPNSEARPNDLVILKTKEDEVYFKKWLGEKKGVSRFFSFNPNYPVMELKEKEIRKIHPVWCVIKPLKGKIF